MEKHESQIELELINEKVKFIGKAGDNEGIIIDYIPPFGNNEGYTALELFLISYTSCISITLLALIQKKLEKSISSMKVKTKGKKKEERPNDFSDIYLEYSIISKDLTDLDFQNMINLAEEKYCSVWAMIKGNVNVDIKYKIEIL